MKNIEITNALDQLPAFTEVVVKDSFGFAVIKNISFDKDQQKIVIDIED